MPCGLECPGTLMAGTQVFKRVVPEMLRTTHALCFQIFCACAECFLTCLQCCILPGLCDLSKVVVGLGV